MEFKITKKFEPLDKKMILLLFRKNRTLI